LVRGASYGITIVAGTPSSRAAAGDALRVVAGGVGDYAAAARLRVELRQVVIGASELERPGALQSFQLEEDTAAGFHVERRRREQRSAPRVTEQPVAGRLDIGDRRQAVHRTAR
jgi:hypothetical protein